MYTRIFQATDLGSFDNIILVAKTVAQATKAVPVQDLRVYFAGRSRDLAYSFEGIIDLLVSINWLLATENKLKTGIRLPVKLLQGDKKKELRHCLILDIFSSLKENNILSQLVDLSSFDFDTQKMQITVLRNSIPLNASGLKNLLLSIKFLLMDPTQPHVYYIEEGYQQFVETEVIEWLRTSINFVDDAGLTYERFKAIQNAKEHAGLLAEEYVIAFERRRLSGHPLLSRVKKISNIKVEAGYDIISFNSITSNEIDRFIEVKSFTKKPEFYWSKNEIGTAEMKGSRYFLYLVDRSLLGNNDYEPQIIQDPYRNVFSNPNWQKDPQNWLIRPSFEPSFLKKNRT